MKKKKKPLNNKKKSLPTYAYLIIFIVIVFIVELFGRVALQLPGTIDKRAIHPYLMTGYFYENSPLAQSDQSYGYEKEGGLYVYNFKTPSTSISDRGDFLFHGRQDLANQVSPTNPLRLFVIGGSVAEGHGASRDEFRWHQRLGQKLTSQLHRKVEVINAAVPSFVTTQERLVQNLFVLPRCPDGILFMNGWNDAASAITGSRPGDPYNMGILYKNIYSPISFGLSRLIADFSHVYRFLITQAYHSTLESIRSRIAHNNQALQNYAHDISAVYFDNLIAMNEACVTHGVPCSFFLQPAQSVTSRRLEPTTDHGDTNKLIDAAYTRILSQQRVMKKFGIKLHDLSPLFDRSPAVFIDPVHFNDEGQALVADQVLPTALALLKTRVSTEKKRRCISQWNVRQKR